jgi:AraC-like DNA-binding protein
MMARDFAQTWRSRHLRDTLFLRAEFRSQRFDRHFHEEYAIGVIDSGCQAFVYDRGRRLDMPGGSVALIAPGVVHAGWPGVEEGWRYRMMYPAATVIEEAAREIFGVGPVPIFDRPVVSDPHLQVLLGRLHDASHEPDSGPMELETLTLAAVRQAFERHAGRRPPTLSARDAHGMTAMRDLIESRFNEPLTLAELSEAAGLSRFHALRQFRTRFGLPPHAYLLQLRVRRARDLVLAGGALADIAVAVGFADQAHMTRAFRRTLGYTPGVLARS